MKWKAKNTDSGSTQVAVRKEQEGRTMKQYTCQGCGTELTALNMSDDEEYCKTCFDRIVAGMDTEDESIETRWMPEGVMEEIIKDKYPRAYTNLPHVQRMRRFKGY